MPAGHPASEPQGWTQQSGGEETTGVSPPEQPSRPDRTKSVLSDHTQMYPADCRHLNNCASSRLWSRSSIRTILTSTKSSGRTALIHTPGQFRWAWVLTRAVTAHQPPRQREEVRGTHCWTGPLLQSYPFTAVLGMASGTFNPLSRVLFTFRSHYLFTIGPVLVLRLARDTPRHSSCSPKQFYSQVSVAGLPSGYWSMGTFKQRGC